MMREFFHISGVACSSLLLAACAGSGDKYPSLEITDAERAVGQFTPTQSDSGANPVPIAPASLQDIKQLVDQASESHRAFTAARPTADSLIRGARGSSAESDARARALVALADLSSKRSDTAIPLGDLDLLAADARTSFAPHEQIVAARALVAGLVEQQDRALAELWVEMQR